MRSLTAETPMSYRLAPKDENAPLLIQEGWRAKRRGGYALKPKA